MCIDLSRYVNLLLQKEPSKLSTIDIALNLTLPGDYQAVYDLEAAYHHVHVKEQDHELLGFEVDSKWYMYTRMPFSLATAGQVLERIIKPIKTRIANKGIQHLIYIDDGRIVARTKEELEVAVEEVYSILSNAGFSLSRDKSDTGNTGSLKKGILRIHH